MTVGCVGFMYSGKTSEITYACKRPKEAVEVIINAINGIYPEKESYLRKKRIDEFTPIEMAKVMKVSNRTIINWAVALAKSGLLEPQLVQKRIRSYRVIQCPRYRCGDEIL